MHWRAKIRGCALMGMLAFVPNALAEVPTSAPTFTHPLDITNVYAPFQPNGIKVLRGTNGGAAAVTVDSYLSATRAFRVGGVSVQAHVLEEISFDYCDIH